MKKKYSFLDILKNQKILEDISSEILTAKKLHRNIYYIKKEDADKYINELKHPTSGSVGEFGKLVGMYRTGVYKNIMKGTLPATKKGGRYYISLEQEEPFKKDHFVKREISETDKVRLKNYYITKHTQIAITSTNLYCIFAKLIIF